MKIHVADAGRKVVALFRKDHNTLYLPIEDEGKNCIYIDQKGVAGICYNSFSSLMSDSRFERIYENQAVTLTF